MIKGSKMSEESKLKMSLAKKGKPNGRKGMPSHNKGIPMSEEQKKKIGDANRGRKMPEEARLKMIASRTGKPSGRKGIKGKPWTEEQKARQSEISKRNGNIPPNLKGHKRTPESVERGAAKRRGQKRPSYTGEKNKNWRGGVTPEYAQIRNSPEYKQWRRSVFERDNYTCVLCGARSCKGIKVVLHADHIKQFAYFPELRLNINNGRTLCKPCHKKTPTYAGNGMKNPVVTDCQNIREFHDFQTAFIA